MQNAAGDAVVQAPHDQNATYRAVVSDLVSLIEHVQKSLRLIEPTIARETSPGTTPGSPESSTNIIVLDDISPATSKPMPRCKPAMSILASPCAPCWIPAMAILVPQACPRFRPSGRKADAALARWSVRCSPAANFPPDFLARSTACCDRSLASGMPPARRRARIPPRRWRNWTRRSII